MVTKEEIAKALRKVYLDENNIEVTLQGEDIGFSATSIELNNKNVVVYGLNDGAMQDLHNIWTDDDKEEQEQALELFVDVAEATLKDQGYTFKDVTEITFKELDVKYK